MAKFNGHKNWNHWNVSLWINNDESLYRAARQYVKDFRGNKDAAAREMYAELIRTYGDNPKTPDGAPYSVSSIRAAMVGM